VPQCPYRRLLGPSNFLSSRYWTWLVNHYPPLSAMRRDSFRRYARRRIAILLYRSRCSSMLRSQSSLRRDVRRRFVRIVSHGVPRLLFASFIFRRRCRFSNVVSSGIPRLTFDMYGFFWRRRFSIGVFKGIRRFTCGKYGVF
jgi:hypothetical protein